MTVEERAKKIKLFLLDVDGVLTDGRIIYDEYGDELKCFYAQDGLGLNLLAQAGIKLGFITSRKAKSVTRRARDCGVGKVYAGVRQKIKSYTLALKRFKVREEQTAYMGDDLFDLPVLKKAGLALSPPESCAEVRALSHYVTARPAGKGAVREVAELILKAQQKWDAVSKPYTA